MLNEGKTFTPVFVLSVFLLFRGLDIAPLPFGQALLLNLPLFVAFYIYDFPLHLRWYLFVPLFGFIVWFGHFNTPLLVWGFGLYGFFTVFFWGTLYYHLRIGTTWWNFTRIWKLFLKNSDSTSGNVLEQLPKTFLLLLTLDYGYQGFLSNETSFGIGGFLVFSLLVWGYSWAVHKKLFNWLPEERADFAGNVTLSNPVKRVVVIVIDGCRKDRFEEADAPFLHRRMGEGAYYDQMETVYPARTVVCFSSMFTGAYPREHGMRSNMVWRLGVRVESVFDKLRQAGKKGVMFGCAHLIDAFGDDVASFTAVEKNDIVDHKIMEQAKAIMKRENPDLFVVQMIAVDQTGHSRGALYPEYLEKIKESDALIRDFHDWMGREGMLEGTAFVVMADHGQGDGIGGHGHLDQGERYVPFLMFGEGIRPGVRVKEHRSIVSLASTICSLLGVALPSNARGPVLTEAIENGQDSNQ